MSFSVDSLRTNLTNPARAYLWEVEFINPIGGGDADTLTVRCQSASIPARSVNPIHVPYKQSAGIQYAGKLKYSQSWSLSFVEGEDKKIHDAIYGWQQQLVHDISNLSAGDEYIKADLYMRLQTTKGEDGMNIRLVGCFPISIGEVSLSQSTEDLIRYEVTFSYDRWQEI